MRRLRNYVLAVIGSLLIVCCGLSALVGRSEPPPGTVSTFVTVAPQTAVPAAIADDAAEALSEPTASVAQAVADDATAEAEPTPTEEPTAEPTEIPAEPTETPAEAAEAPTEAPALPVAITGLGVEREVVEVGYQLYGYTFVDSPLADGEARRIGKHPDSHAVELIGPADDLRKISTLTYIEYTEQDSYSGAGRAVGLMLGSAFSEEEAELRDQVNVWLQDELKTATNVSPDEGGHAAELELTGGRYAVLSTLNQPTGMIIVCSIERR